jgi:hypothetical protein
MVQSGIDQLREQVRGAVITPDDEATSKHAGSTTP